jgi:rhodanese-related sulfurtransferase
MMIAALIPLVVAASAESPGGSGGESRRVDASTAVELMSEPNTEVIDVRTPAEHAEGHLAGARLIDVQRADFVDRLDELDRDRTYLLYCRSGTRSGHAARIMADMGFSSPINIGGYDELVRAGATPAS